MKSSKVIFVKAYLNQNLGDDLFVDILVKRYPQHNFMIIVPNKNYYHFSKYKNVKLIKLNKVKKLINFLSFKLIDKNINLVLYLASIIITEKNYDNYYC